MGEEQPVEQSIDDFMSERLDSMEETPAAPEVEASEDVSHETDDVEAENPSPDEEVSQEETEGAEPEKVITPPQSMSAKDCDEFAKLSPESQKWVTDREKQQTADYTRKTMELADQKKGYDKLDQILAPRRQQLALDGMDESTAVGQLFALSDFANQNPVGFVQYLFQQRGIPMSALTEPGAQESTDPQLAAMQAKLQGFENHFSQVQQHQTQVSEAAIVRDIEAFSSENEHYSELESEMLPVVKALKEQNPSMTNAAALQKAYKMAIAGNESVSAKVDADNKAKMEVVRAAKAKKAATDAKAASGANLAKSGALPSGSAKVTDLDDFIGDLVDERMTA